MACVIKQKDIKQWFAELSVDMDKVRKFNFRNNLENLYLMACQC